MADMAVSVLARLKNKAKESGKTIKAFLTKPFTAAIGGKEFVEKWAAINGEWIEGRKKNGM